MNTATSQSTYYDVIILGAGAAGLMCAGLAGQRGKRVLVLDHAKKIGEKIRIAGGGRCNFTNLHTAPEAFISQNPHFCKSALKQYTQWDFIDLVERHGIVYHEKKLGQLFCDDSAQNIIDMLLAECAAGGVRIEKETHIRHVHPATDDACENTNNDSTAARYQIETADGTLLGARNLVVATGGLSIPKIGASKFGYDIAKQFGLNVVETRPALVPLTFSDHMLERCRALSGISVDALVTCGKTSFREGLLFTHRGLSGPSILQISSYWQEGDDITVNLAPETDIAGMLKQRKDTHPKQDVQTALSHILPARLAEDILRHEGISGRLADLSNKVIDRLGAAINNWHIRPNGSEGYRTAEVTLYGIDTDALSSKTMECKTHKGLYFIGEVVDVTGHLGGYNFQWAWSSAYVAARHIE